MDIFAFRDRLIGDYQEYVESYLDIKDKRIRDLF